MAKIAAIFQLLDKNVTVSSHRLELLSPARDAAIAREAILHGADAVYIGGPGFGARHNASNSLKDIAELVPFAHRYGAKIFVTLNTILHDDELEPAQRLITDLYQLGNIFQAITGIMTGTKTRAADINSIGTVQNSFAGNGGIACRA